MRNSLFGIVLLIFILTVSSKMLFSKVSKVSPFLPCLLHSAMSLICNTVRGICHSLLSIFGFPTPWFMWFYFICILQSSLCVLHSCMGFKKCRVMHLPTTVPSPPKFPWVAPLSSTPLPTPNPGNHCFVFHTVS